MESYDVFLMVSYSFRFFSPSGNFDFSRITTNINNKPTGQLRRPSRFYQGLRCLERGEADERHRPGLAVCPPRYVSTFFRFFDNLTSYEHHADLPNVSGQLGALMGVFLAGPLTSRIGYRYATLTGLMLLNVFIFSFYFAKSLPVVSTYRSTMYPITPLTSCPRCSLRSFSRASHGVSS
jgi:hypothetical protein